MENNTSHSKSSMLASILCCHKSDRKRSDKLGVRSLPKDTEIERKENPLVLKYVKLVRTFLWILGAWPGKALGEREPLFITYHRKYEPVQAFVILQCEIYFLVVYYGDISFFVKGQCVIVIFLTVLTFARAVLPTLRQYAEITRVFFVTFHLIHFKHNGEYSQKVYAIVDKVSYSFAWYLMAMMVGGMVLFNLSPWYLNYKNGVFTGQRVENSTLELSVYFAFPGFDPVDHFMFVTIYNVYLCYNCATYVCAIDLLMSLMVFQIIGHILILRNNLENLPRPRKQTTVTFNMVNGDVGQSICEMYDAEENENIHGKLVECVNHHRMIVSFTQDISDFFGPMLALNYSFHLFSCCLLLLECSQGDPAALFRFAPLTIIIFGQLIQISVTFEVVATVSEKLKDCVYLMPWECMDIRNRRSVYILLNRVQTPIKVTAMGMTSVGVTTMAGILKTTFSYFTFLKSMEI